MSGTNCALFIRVLLACSIASVLDGCATKDLVSENPEAFYQCELYRARSVERMFILGTLTERKGAAFFEAALRYSEVEAMYNASIRLMQAHLITGIVEDYSADFEEAESYAVEFLAFIDQLIGEATGSNSDILSFTIESPFGSVVDAALGFIPTHEQVEAREAGNREALANLLDDLYWPSIGEIGSSKTEKEPEPAEE